MHENCFSSLPAFAALLAQASPSGPAPQIANQVIFMVLIGVIMYFILIRPQQLRAKQQAKLLAALKAGDKVVTSAGIVGTVVTIKEKDKTVSLRSGDAKFEVTKASITDVIVDAPTPTTP